MSPVSAAVVLALGSNLGDRVGTLHGAMRAIAEIPDLELTAVSSLYESVAVKPDGVDPDAPRYLNAVVTARYRGDPLTLLDAVQQTENEAGRVRAERWGDRTLDIDIVLFGEIERSDDRLTLPHPRAWERDFVLAPWLEIAPDATIPARGSVAELLAATGNDVRVFEHAGPPR